MLISRQAAKARGLLRYFTGKPCPHGHNGERWVSSGACYECTKAKAPGVVKRWRDKQDPDELRAYRATERREWRKRDPERAHAHDRRMRTPRRRAYAQRYATEWRVNNAEHIRQYNRDRQARLLIEDPQYRLRLALRTRLNRAINGSYRTGSAVRDLGCSIAEFKVYVEAQFEPGMSWDNWSRNGWHLDHIKPLAGFDLTDRAQFLEACHYTNIRPMWGDENRKRPRLTQDVSQILSKYPRQSL